MAGPLSGKSGFRIPGCAITLALAGMLLAAFFALQPAKQTAPAAEKLASAAPASQQSGQHTGQQAGQGPQFPRLTGRVVDAANVIPDDAEARIAQKLEALELQTKRQLVVATLPSLQGYEISDYGYQLGRAWGIGSKQDNDGALLIVAPVERKLRVEVGYGLEGILTDGLTSLIINETIVPKLKAGDMAGGIEAGSDALIGQLGLPDAQARSIAAQARPAQDSARVDNLFFYFIIFLFFLSFIVPMIRRSSRGRRYSDAIAPVVIWDALANSGSSSSSGWGGGGGFSGGGGSFGGGGSSGSW